MLGAGEFWRPLYNGGEGALTRLENGKQRPWQTKGGEHPVQAAEFLHSLRPGWLGS